MDEEDRNGDPHKEDDRTGYGVSEDQPTTELSDADEAVVADAESDPHAAESASAMPTELGETPERLADLVAGLTAEVREHHSRAAAREHIIDKLHAETERLKAGEQNLLLRPIVTDLQNLRKDLLNQARALPAEMDREQIVGLLNSYALSVELALERCGSVPIHPAIGDQFSTREHRAVKVFAADRPEQDGTIAEVMADGYRDTETDRVTAPARVHVYRWKSADVSDAQHEQESADA